MEHNAPAVSVILPVYNVGAYLDICMESLLGQTFADFEALLIDDGSTDDSAARCRAWVEKDGRVRFVHKQNEGVAATRNLGVQLARGEYLAFVDPDDWLDSRYLEKLFNQLEETGADFAECGLWRVDNRTGRRIERSCFGRMGRPYTLREHMIYGPTATYKSMSRRSLWQRWNIRMPDCAFESPAIYALVLALAGRVENVCEPLYYYRRFRENSLIENGYAGRDGRPDPALGVEAMAYLLGEFRRCGLYERYADTLEAVVKYRLSDILAMQFHRRTEEEFARLVENQRAFLAKAFPEGRQAPYFTWGGYNLNRILLHMPWLHDSSCRYNFMSLAVMADDAPTASAPAPRHPNRYRQMMLERERARDFWARLRCVRPAVLFMDLIEERFDFARAGGTLFTRSDAFEGSSLTEDSAVIPRESAEGRALWRAGARRFFARLRREAPDLRIVLIENELSLRAGNLKAQREYPDVKALRGTNERLRALYREAEALCPEAIVVRPADEPLYFSDEKYEYGAVPQHLNEIVNQRIAQRILRALPCL